MTQEEADEIFKSDLGQKLKTLFVTADDQTFVKYRDAMQYTFDEVKNLNNSVITEWHPNQTCNENSQNMKEITIYEFQLKKIIF